MPTSLSAPRFNTRAAAALAALVCAALHSGAQAQAQTPPQATPQAALAAPADTALQGCRSLADATTRLACYDALPLAAVAAVAAPTAAPNPAASKAEATKGFGLEHQSAAAQLTDIDSSLVGAFDGWSPNDRITLANGQVWQVIDGSSGVVALKSAKVKVRRGVLGTFYLEFDGSNRSPKVRRVQ